MAATATAIPEAESIGESLKNIISRKLAARVTIKIMSVSFILILDMEGSFYQLSFSKKNLVNYRKKIII
ncbi:MAG: hypothetical protein Q8903_08475, partial [Bacteroidota bacterium]|nr:hypothetical protein [Bacteroidota bacterium]